MGISLEKLREEKLNQPKEKIGPNGERMRISRVDHVCDYRTCKNRDKIITKGSPVWEWKHEANKFETTDTGVKPLGSEWKTYYGHFPDCDNPEIAPKPKLPPKEVQEDLF